MVVWVFAGGGDSEIRGLIPLLKEQFPTHTFVRKSPVKQKPRPRPFEETEQSRSIRARAAHGRTGKGLANQLKSFLSSALRTGEKCDLVLVLDDLDCHDPDAQRELFRKAIDSVNGATDLQSYVGFASPEVEAWIIADWGNTIAKDADFRGSQQKVRHWLSTRGAVPFERPEEFSSLDPKGDSCLEKLSDTIVKSSLQCAARARFSKGIHTPRFLKQISPEVVSGKCPLFRELHNHLSSLE